MDFAEFITPEKAYEFEHTRSLGELKKLAADNGTCENCDNHVWRYGGCGLCFPCTTGESDASDDYEIGEFYL